jgi:hypothetical protein
MSKIKQRLELALRPAGGPAPGEVLAAMEKNGKLCGPVDWVFPAWITYVEYATQRTTEAFQLTEEKRRQLLDFRDAVKRLLPEAQRQAKAKLTAIYNATTDGTYKIEGRRLYAPDGTWIYIGGSVPHLNIYIYGVTAETYFPDLLKHLRERLELLQLGWRASDEGEMDCRPFMSTTQTWQVFAWTATRYEELYMYIASANLTREGVSVAVHPRANSWRQR